MLIFFFCYVHKTDPNNGTLIREFDLLAQNRYTLTLTQSGFTKKEQVFLSGRGKITHRKER